MAKTIPLPAPARKPLTHAEAKKEIKRLGHGRVEGDALLLSTIQTLCMVHAFSETLLYEGATKSGVTAAELRRMTVLQQSDLQFA